MKKAKRNKRAIIDAYKKQNSDVNVYKHIHLIKLTFVDGMSIAKAIKEMCMSESWGIKWCKRYKDRGLDRLQTRFRSGRPSRVPHGLMRRVMRMARKISYCWTVEYMKSRMLKTTGITFDLSYVRKIMKNGVMQ